MGPPRCWGEVRIKHKHSHQPPTLSRPAPRLLLGITAALLIGAGTLTLMAGKLHYQNYWRGDVFAPFGILVGVLLLLIAIGGPNIKRGRSRVAPPPPWKHRR